MADKTSGYDGEIDWEEEIIAADLAALQEAEREEAGVDDQMPNFGKRKQSFFQKLRRKLCEAGGVCYVPDPNDLPIGVKGQPPRIVTREQKRKFEQLAAETAVAPGKRNANGIFRGVMALSAVVLSMTADAALRPAELIDDGYGYSHLETVNVVNGAQVFYREIYQYFSEKYQTTDWMELEGLIPYGMWEGYVVTEVNTVLEDGDIANFKVPSRYYHQGQSANDAPNWWETVVGIDADVMRGRAIRGLLLPDNLIFVGERAFESCHELRYVGFGDTVTNLGERVFADCIALDHVHLPTNAWLGVAAFSNCVSLTDVVLPRYPTAIPDRCFMDCAALTRVALPNAVEQIGAGAFAHTGLEKLTMPTNLVEIQDGAFLGCTNLSAVLFFENLSTIASNAFAGCSRLTKLVFLGKAPTVQGSALDGIPSNAIVYVTDHWDGPRDWWCGLEVRQYAESSSTVRFTWLDEDVVVADMACYPDFHCGELPAIPLRYVTGYYYGRYGESFATSYYDLSFETWRYLDGGLPTPFDIMVSGTNAVSSSFAEGERKTVMFDLADVSGDYMDWGYSLYDTINNVCYNQGEYGGISSSVELWSDRLAALPDVWACEPASSIFVGWDMDFADIAQSPTNLSVHAVYRWKTAGESFNESGLSRYVLDAEALAVDGIVQFSGVIELDDPAAKLYDVGVARSFRTFERQFENLNLQLVGVSDDGRERKVLKMMPLMMVVSQMFHDYYYRGDYPYETGSAVDRWVMQIPLSDIEGCEYFELQLVSGAMTYYWPYDEVVTGDVHVPEWSNTHLWASLVDCRNQSVQEICGRYMQCGDILKVVGGGDLNLSTCENYNDWYCGLLDNPYQYDRLHRRLGQWLSYEYGSYSLPVYYVRIPDADSWKWDYCSGYGGTYSDQESFHNEWSDFYWDDGAWSRVRWDRVWDDYYSYHYISPQLQSEQITIQTSTGYQILLPGTDIIYYDLGRYGRLTNSTPEYVVDRDGQKCWCAEGERPVLGDENLQQVVYWRLAAPKGIDWRGWWLDPILVSDVSTNDDFQVADGWSFVGWSKDPSEAGNKDVLVAQYKLTEYRLAYENTKGAQNSNPMNFTVVDAIEFAALPDIPGWTFKGWSPKSIAVGTIGDVTVTAVWEQISNAVVFVEGSHGRRCGGGELRQAVAWGECAQVPQIVADDGWRFVGWEGGDVAAPVKSAQAFVARYEAINYSLRFEGLKGATVDYPATFTVEDAIGFAPLADTEDFRFDGWMIGGEYVTGLASGSWGDKVVTAHWTPFVKLGEDGIRGWTGVYDGDEHTVSVSVAEPETYDVACTRLVSGRPVSAWSSEKNVCDLMIRVVVSAAGYAPVYKDVSVVITPQSLTNCTLTASGTAEYINGPVTWSKRAYDPVAKMTMLERQDYTVSYRQTGDFSGAVTFTGKGNYTGTVTVPAEISITMPYETTGGTTWYYQTSGRTATLVRRGDAIASSLTGAVVIPSTVNGLPVTEIADGAFANCSEVTAFVIPEGVAILGDGVFAGCSALKSVVFLGDAPEAPRTFGGAPAELIVYAMPGSRGWGAPVHDVLPERWPFGDDESLTRVIAWLPEVEITPTTGIRSGRVAVTMNYAGVPGIEREIRYTSDGTDPVAASTLYDKRFSLNVDEKTMVKAAAFCGGYRFGSVSSSTFLTSLEEVIVNEGSGAVVLANDVASPWTYDDAELGCGGKACLRSGAISDNMTSSLTATFEGEGVLTFSWKTACEYDDFGEFFFDHAECLLDGVVVAQADDETDWTDVEIPVSGKGVHSLVWRYVKDDADEDGADYEDCVWLGNVAFSCAENELQPTVVGDEGAVLTGDEEIGFVIRPSGTKTVVEVEIPIGLDAAKVTVEVTVAVTSLKSNGAKVKIVSGGADITEFLDLPSADGEGVIDLSRAAVRSEIVNEVLDPEKGAVIELTPDSPTLTTVNTRPGLVYTLHEGATLDGMTSGDSKVGDGEPWTPDITVKGGNSAFYFISVGK